jgi:hypothetical protein
MIELINATFAAGEQKDFVIAGGRFEVIDAASPVDVFLLDASGAQLSVMRSAEASFYAVPKSGFKHIQIRSAQAQTVRFLVGSGDAGTRRAAGTVQLAAGATVQLAAGAAVSASVVDAGRQRSLSVLSHTATNTQQAASTWNMHLQLWNPVGSGKYLHVRSLSFSTDAATAAVLVGFGQTQLTTASGYTGRKNPADPGGVDSVAMVRHQEQAGVIAGALTVRTLQHFVNAGAVVRVPFEDPLVIFPGWGLTVCNISNANKSISANWDFCQE